MTTDELARQITMLCYTDRGTPAPATNLVEITAILDAALRRAKAEGVREIVRGLKNKRIDFEQKLSVTRSSFMQDEYEANIELLSELITEADARAAQIEEGGDHGINR